MRIGLIAEGKSDIAVLENLIRGIFSLDREFISYLTPKMRMDKTRLERFKMKEEEFSNWTLVKSECQEKENINKFFSNPIDEDRYLIVQIDSAESHLIGFDIDKPDKTSDDYYQRHRELIISKINEWLGRKYLDRVIYAITIEETEAWVATLFLKSSNETGKENNPKNYLNKLLNKLPDKEKKKIFQMDTYERFVFLSKPFTRRKTIDVSCKMNQSLKQFIEQCDALIDIT